MRSLRIAGVALATLRDGVDDWLPEPLAQAAREHDPRVLQTGETVATVEDVSAQGSITRLDEAPAASISADIASADTGKDSANVQAEIDALVEGLEYPRDYFKLS